MPVFKIDHTQLQTFVTCPRKYQYKYLLKLKKRIYDEREIDMDFGRCIHEALALWYKDSDVEKSKQWFKEHFHGLPNEKVKTPANGLQLLDWYSKYYCNQQNELSDHNLTTKAIEVTDTFPLTDTINYTVKVDRIVDSSSGIWIMEHKTTKSLGATYFYTFDPNSQVSGYCYYCLQKYGQCSGLIVNAMAMGYRERAYKGEPAGFHAKFVREIINRNSEQLESWKANVITWVWILQSSIKSRVFPMNEGACHQYRGCQYRELCINCGDEQIQEELYEQHEPLTYLNEQS